MELRVDRKYKKSGYTISNLYINGTRFCNVLEDTDRGLVQMDSLAYIKTIKVYGYTAIPKGRYKIDMNTVSEKFKNREWAKPYKGKLPRLMGVPGFDGVLIHVGNKADDTLGCLLVGKNTTVGRVNQSTATFHSLMKGYLVPAHLRGEDIYITIE